jgi:beta-glucosidase-like glycosyl hydrolase
LAGAHDVIGDRAFSADPAEVARLGAAWVRGLQSAGCIPVIKHIPGHGRALVDSHESLPRVEASAADLAADLAPFRDVAAMCGSASLWAMTAHILYAAWDGLRPATLSPTIIGDVIRGEIGFDGVLVSDDLAMGAMQGQSNDLAGAAIGAGCDVLLHCTGVLEETAALLGTCPMLPDSAGRRLAAARDAVQRARRPVAALASADNAQVNRAAEALGRLGVASAVLPLIAALETEHASIVTDGRAPGSTSATFTPSGGGFSMGGGPKRVMVKLRNDRVLEALIALTGMNFQWDQAAWRAWLANERSLPPDFDLRRG